MVIVASAPLPASRVHDVVKAAGKRELYLAVEASGAPHGWALPGDVSEDSHAQDDRDAQALLDLIEKEVAPLFYERDAEGVPRAWMARVKAGIRAAGLAFTSDRMLTDYVRQAYRVDKSGDGPDGPDV